MTLPTTALVAGGDRHLPAIVAGLTRLGVQVVLQTQGDAEREAATRVADAAGGTVEVLDKPVCSFAEADELVAAVAATHDGLGILLTPPVRIGDHALADLDERGWHADRTAFQLRAVALARAAARQFVAQGAGGRVVTFSDAATFSSTGVTQAAVNASMLSLTSAIAGPLAVHGVTANCVVLGDGGDAAGEPDLVGSLVAHLCSPDGAAVNGRFVYAAGRDLGFLSMPLAIENPHALVRFGDDAGADDVAAFLSPLSTIGRA